MSHLFYPAATVMYAVVNTASSEDEVPPSSDAGAAVRPKRKDRSRTDEGNGTAAANSGMASDEIGAGAGFTPTWRDGMEGRVEARRERIAASETAGRPRPAQAPRTQNQLMDDEEESKY